MKSVKYALSILSFLSPVMAERMVGNITLSSKVVDELTITGNADLQHVQGNTITIFGKVSLNDLKCSQLKVTGPVAGENCTISRLYVTGKGEFKNCTVETFDGVGKFKLNAVKATGLTAIVGKLRCAACNFNTLELSSKRSELIDSHVGDLTVKKETVSSNVQTIHLKGKSHIKSIVFESGLGEVHIYGADVKIDSLKGAKRIQH